MDKEPSKLQQRYEKIKAEKAVEAAYLKKKYIFKSGKMYLCPQSDMCGECPLKLAGTCQGCNHVHCVAKVCGRWCFGDSELKQNFCKTMYDRCMKMPTEFLQKDFDEVGEISIDNIVDLIKPTKPLDLETDFIPTIQPYGKHAPGEIVKHEDAFVEVPECDNIVMVPSNQLPLSIPWDLDDTTAANYDPSKIYLKKVDLKKHLGVTKKTRLFLNFRMLDVILDFWWSRMVFDSESGVATLVKSLQDYGIEVTANINFSMWDKFPLYHLHFNMLRSLLSFAIFQEYFDNVILEFDYSDVNQQIDDNWLKIINEGGIATITQNFQLSRNTEDIFTHPLRRKLPQKLECEEILMGGASNLKNIHKYSRIYKDKRIYVTSTRAYLSTVFQQHLSGGRYKEAIPPAEDEYGRAMYYKHLFESNVRYYSKELPKWLAPYKR